MKDILKEINQSLRIGKRYTFVYFNDKGFLDYTHFIANSFMLRKTDKYGYHIMVIVKNGVKWDRYIHIQDGKQFLIYEDYVKINKDPIVLTRSMHKFSHVKEFMCWPPFDNRYLQRAVDELEVKPIFKQIDPIDNEEILISYCTMDTNERNK